MILTIRTDKPEAEVGFYNLNGQELKYHTWYAHRELSNTLLSTIRDQLASQHKMFEDLSGIVVFQGPGSFTGLRIGITVGNTLAYGLAIPIVGAKGDEWQQNGLQALHKNHNDHIVLPEYGAEAHITKPKK